jgi:signal peptidase II
MKKVLLWSTALTFVLDQITKYIIVHWMGLISKGTIDVWPGFIQFRMAWNTGVNFGLLSGNGDLVRWLLVFVSLVICIFVGYWIRGEKGVVVLTSGGFVIGGALGNSIDRILYGGVADFLNISCCGFQNPYAFNVADITIFIGIFGLVLFSSNNDKKLGPNS